MLAVLALVLGDGVLPIPSRANLLNDEGGLSLIGRSALFNFIYRAGGSGSGFIGVVRGRCVHSREKL